MIGPIVGRVIELAMELGMLDGLTMYAGDAIVTAHINVHAKKHADVRKLAERIIAGGATFIDGQELRVVKSGMWVWAEATVEFRGLHIMIMSKHQLVTEFDAEMRERGIDWKVAS